jgi:tetratricopeptide (TPR) repeat protein
MQMSRTRKKQKRPVPSGSGGDGEKTRVTMMRPGLHAGLIVVLGLVIYVNSLSAPFVFDDYNYIVDNPVIKDLAYFTDSSRMAGEEIRSRLVENHNTRFIVFLTFAMNYLVHGLQVTGYHVVNILIHLGAALLVWQLVLVTLQTPFFRSAVLPERQGRVLALFAGLLFVSHPIQTQAVTYISQRFTSLAALFYLLSMAMFARSRLAFDRTAAAAGGLDAVPPAKCWLSLPYVLSMLAAVMAMKTKEISFTLPLMIVLFEFLFFEGPKRERLLLVLPLLCTLLVIPLTLWGDRVMRIDLAALFQSVSAAGGENRALTYLFTQFRVIVTYLRLLVIPMGQTFDYDYQESPGMRDPATMLSLLFLLLVFGTAVYMVWRSRREQIPYRAWLRLLAFGILWFFLALSVESSFLPLEDLIFEHRLYLPSVGFFLTILAAAGLATDRYGATAWKSSVVVLAGSVIIWSAAAIARNAIWSDTVALYADNAQKSPNKPRPRQNLGFSYLFRGRYQEAIHQYETAIEMNRRLMEHPEKLPYSYLPHRVDERVPVDRLKRLRDETATIHNNLGAIYEQLGRLTDAEREYREAVRLWKDLASAHSNLGNLLKKQGRLDDAIASCHEAVRIDPWFAEYHFNLGNAYATRGDYADAAAAYEKALALDPVHAKAREHLLDVRKRQRAAEPARKRP